MDSTAVAAVDVAPHGQAHAKGGQALRWACNAA
jgi:hypothetical protein